MNVLNSINVILPEFVLIVGALMLLMLGSFKKGDSFKFVTYATFGICLFALMIVIIRYNGENASGDTGSTNGLFAENTNSNEAFNGNIDSFAFTSFIKCLILISGSSILLMVSSLNSRQNYARFELPILILISLAGMMLVVSSNSLLSLYVSMEMMSLPLYILAASDRHNEKSAEAGLKYFILGSLSSGLFLFGVSLIYGYTGYVKYDDLIRYFAMSIDDADSVNIPIGLLVGLIFLTVSVCFKISAVPFHMWTPDVYQGSPTVITAFFASAPKVAGMALFVRLMLDPFAVLYEQWVEMIIFVSISSMIVGSFAAIIQKNIKRLLAYSSIGHIGFALTGLVSGDVTGIQGLFVYISIYISMSIGAFAIIMLMNDGTGYPEKLKDFQGLGKRMPTLAFMLSVIMFSMAGIPPLAGFFAKFYVLLPVIKQQLFGVAVVFVLMSIVSAFYYLKVIKYMYFDEVSEDVHLTYNNHMGLVIIATMCTLFNLFFVFSPAELLLLGEKAAGIFLD